MRRVAGEVERPAVETEWLWRADRCVELAVAGAIGHVSHERVAHTALPRRPQVRDSAGRTGPPDKHRRALAACALVGTQRLGNRAVLGDGRADRRQRLRSPDTRPGRGMGASGAPRRQATRRARVSSGARAAGRTGGGAGCPPPSTGLRGSGMPTRRRPRADHACHLRAASRTSTRGSLTAERARRHRAVPRARRQGRARRARQPRGGRRDRFLAAGRLRAVPRERSSAGRQPRRAGRRSRAVPSAKCRVTCPSSCSNETRVSPSRTDSGR